MFYIFAHQKDEMRKKANYQYYTKLHNKYWIDHKPRNLMSCPVSFILVKSKKLTETKIVIVGELT